MNSRSSHTSSMSSTFSGSFPSGPIIANTQEHLNMMKLYNNHQLQNNFTESTCSGGSLLNSNHGPVKPLNNSYLKNQSTLNSVANTGGIKNQSTLPQRSNSSSLKEH